MKLLYGYKVSVSVGMKLLCGYIVSVSVGMKFLLDLLKQ